LRLDSQGGSFTLVPPEPQPEPEAEAEPEAESEPPPQPPEVRGGDPDAPEIGDVLSEMWETEQQAKEQREAEIKTERQAIETSFDSVDLDVDAILTAAMDEAEALPEPEPEPEPEEQSEEFRSAVLVSQPEPASRADLEKLKDWSEGKAGASGQKAEGKPHRGRQILNPILDALGPPRRVRTLDGFYREIDLLKDVVNGRRGWTAIEREDQQALIGVIAARCRHLQDEASPALGHPLALMSLDNLFSGLTSYSARHRPGFVLGLMREHTPDHGDTWVEEARHWWRFFGRNDLGEEDAPEEPVALNPERELDNLADVVANEAATRKDIVRATLACLKAKIQIRDPRLIKILLPHLRKLDKEKRLKGLRKNIRAYQREVEAEGAEADADVEALPANWPHRNRTEGETLILVGGDRRDKTAKRYRDVFGFKRVEWISGWEPRRIDAAAKRIASGSYTAVIFLSRFLSHKAWDSLSPVCKTSGTPYAIVERGYGVSQARVALEKAFSVGVNGG
jgi:hypothetical protein